MYKAQIIVQSSAVTSMLPMVVPTRFERVAYRLGICRSILLSYGTDRTVNFIATWFTLSLQSVFGMVFLFRSDIPAP